MHGCIWCQMKQQVEQRQLNLANIWILHFSFSPPTIVYSSFKLLFFFQSKNCIRLPYNDSTMDAPVIKHLKVQNLSLDILVRKKHVY
jgi:hypothetical protein